MQEDKLGWIWLISLCFFFQNNKIPSHISFIFVIIVVVRIYYIVITLICLISYSS